MAIEINFIQLLIFNNLPLLQIELYAKRGQ